MLAASTAADGGADGPPRFMSAPGTTAFCNLPYRYGPSRTPSVAGTGPFTFSLVPALDVPLPAGARIDPGTGEIAWTPSARDVGVHPMALRVEGSLGRASQTFAIAVECPSAGPLAVGCGCGLAGAQAPLEASLGALLAAGALALAGAALRRPVRRTANGRSAIGRVEGP